MSNLNAAYYSARIARAFRSLAVHSVVELAKDLASIERAQELHALRVCNGEDGGYVKPTRQLVGGVTVCGVEHDPVAQERAGKRIAKRIDRWRERLRSLLLCDTSATTPQLLDRTARLQQVQFKLDYDPRGSCLTVVFPGEP